MSASLLLRQRKIKTPLSWAQREGVHRLAAATAGTFLMCTGRGIPCYHQVCMPEKKKRGGGSPSSHRHTFQDPPHTKKGHALVICGQHVPPIPGSEGGERGISGTPSYCVSCASSLNLLSPPLLSSTHPLTHRDASTSLHRAKSLCFPSSASFITDDCLDSNIKTFQWRWG